ncbi:uncharacterized protein RJT20DRAFT_95998 [Scheffersomyces xylosifermentans]|uniref:uncharacterized protein n=1 Tax=Scheffersomyces xylosifermentans TaxID=1304137 RepID=UPI00315D3569
MAQARTTTKGSSKFPLGGPTSPSGSPPSPSSPSVGKFTSDPITSSYNIDRESIYSFDSVSTNGRLLDRLGFDNEDLFDDDNELTRRDSAISVTSTGNAFERLEIDEHRSKLRSLSKTPSLNKDRYPTGSSASLQNNLAAIRGLSRPSPGTTTGSGSSSHHHHQPSQAQRDSHVSLKHVPMKVVFQTTNNSVDSFKSDMASINKINTSSSTSLQTLVRQNLQNGSSVTMTSSESSSSGSNYNSREYGTRTPLQGNSPTSNVSPDSPETINQFEFSSSNDSINNLPETPNLNSSRYNDIAPTPDTSSLPKARAGIMRTPSAPVVGTVRNDISYDTMESTSANGSPVRRRIISEGSQSSYSNASIGNFSRVESRTPPSSSTSTFSSSSTSNLTPESRTKLAQQLRKIGKHREASYQLQIAANVPNNYPRAMLLYALALRYGNGVKQNDKHSIKWLCKCILIHSSHASIAANISSVMEKLNNLQFEELVRLIIKNLDNTINMDPNKNGTDPVELFDVFSTFTTAQKSRIATISKSQADIVAVSYHELGNALYQGWGLESKDEINGIKCLSKAGSLGYVGAMVALGEIWSTKSKNRKKDLYKAAAWLRLGEIFGVKSMGNSWIYKEKYMPVK